VKPRLEIPSLDGLRTLSFGFVFLAHAGLAEIVPGAFGVTVFFFLSGYLITTLMRLEFEETGHVSLRQFYFRRVLRIHPPFYLVLTLAVLASLVGLLPRFLDPRAVTAQALHYANYWIIGHGFEGIPLGTGVYWSLAVEEHFYLVFPWMFGALRALGGARVKQAATLLALCALVLAWRCWLVLFAHVPEERTAIASDARFDSILFGCALALYGNPALDESRISERVWKLGLLPVALLGLLASFLVRSGVFRETLRYTLQGVCLMPVFVCAVRFPTWAPFKLLNLRPMKWVGKVSYSLYLVHQVVIGILYPRVTHAYTLLLPGSIALALSVSIAALIYRFIELPCAKLRRRLHA
jgi:peptidoglycan/LPS O-acetylase OafA/YrhL